MRKRHEPEYSPIFAKVAKKTALDIIGSALKDVAKGQVKEAAKQIYELGKDLGPVIVNRVHPPTRVSRAVDRDRDPGMRLLAWLGDRDRRGTAALRSLLAGRQRLIEVPVLGREPTDIQGLETLARTLAARGFRFAD